MEKRRLRWWCVTAAIKYLKSCLMEEFFFFFSFFFVGPESRKWDQWEDIILTQIWLDMRKNFLTIRISSSGNSWR